MNGPTPDFRAYKSSPSRRALLALYGEVDALTHGITCDASTDCCRFGVTGREPYPTAIELAEVFLAVDASGRRARALSGAARRLPIAPAARRPADERRCPLLDDAGRCSVYAARPFGCRTFFCARAAGSAGEPPDLPRKELRRLGHALADLSARFAPADPHPRPLSRALADYAAFSRR
jgi:Fe-S-cluster containining protein